MVSNHTNIDYYLKLFKGLRDKINDFIYDNTDLIDSVDIGKDDLKKFSLMIMFSDDGGNSFRWLLLDDQKEFVIKRLETNNSIKNLAIKSNEFFKNWIKFRLQKSGLVNYFLQTPKNTEFIKNFTKEKYLISQGYEKDYENQKYFLNLRKVYRGALNNDQFDPFKELEKNWGFKDVPFYYVKLPKTKELQFIAIFPVISSEQNVFFERADLIFTLVKNAVLGANLMKEIIDENLLVLYQQQLKTAIISILIDSYAHNISAHSLAALKWWIELRHKMLDKRFKIEDNGLVLNCISPCIYSIDKNKTKETTEKYYEALGLTDSTYNADYYSLYDFLQFAENDVVEDLFKYTTEVIPKEGENFKFHPRFPVPIDYALYPFFRFLRDKGAFWSGVTRDMAFGGESKTWFKILWEDFANNPLYLGTIAKSEGITKINIYLKVKTKEEWIEGKFVTIDMSIIDYEEKLSQSPTLEPDESLLNNTVKEDDCNFSNNCSVKYENYSKYAFVKLGKCFKGFREILDNEENFRVFLPGGIVGEHALFTIFENTIRNIKHYKDPNTLKYIQENGIDFWISIEEDKLSISKDNSDKKPELFKVGVWLGHETKLITKEETKNDDGTLKEPAEYLLFNITENTLKPILDESTGAPRMGGNSQDKACAAMLFNNKFSSVENKGEKSTDGKINERDKEYFPWIRFSTTIGRNEYLLDIKSDTTEMEIEELKNQYSNKFLCCGNNGYLKKYFYVWRGEDVLDKNALSADEWENPARAKFLVNDKAWKDEDIIKARKNGVIRLLDESSKPKNIDELNKLYTKWLVKWIKNNVGYQIDFCSDTDFKLAIKIENEDIKFLPITNHTTLKKSLNLIHGNEFSYNCNVRSHGSFWNKFFDESFLNKDPKNLDRFIEIFENWSIEKQKKKKLLMLEFWEAVLSNVVIFDNRIALRVPKAYQEKRDQIDAKNRRFSKNDMLQKDLSLFVYEEDVNRFNFWLRKINPCNKNVNFLIIHLSFIESITDNSSHKYSEDTLDKFIEEKLDDVIYYKENDEKKLRDDFILVITSGRGRDKWRDALKNKDTKYEKFTIFKPVESLLSAIEQGISYNDHFDIKYNLIKVLFGN